ncbi:MAG: hypothetical protein ABIH24_06445 [Verrucomicrobiota bacterium]
MKFSVGYQMAGDGFESFADIVKDYREHIGEVYFAWINTPSGRSPAGWQDGFRDWEAQGQIEKELAQIKNMGLRLTLLMNANCFGGDSMSQHLVHFVISVVEHLSENIGLDAVTTASPLIAHVIKKHFEKIEVRSSVNMGIGTVKGIEYLSDIFDDFCIQRDYNRDLGRIAELKVWADAHGKKLSLLANSGCLRFCSGQIFHDNLVAHEKEISGHRNIDDWNPCVCWRYFQDRQNWTSLLQNTWIRPEDIDHYAPWFKVVKLATRMHSNPRGVIGAYARRSYHGNLLNLLEPGHAALLAPYQIDNQKFPADWFAKTTQCDKRCHCCTYCQSVLEKVLVAQV